MLASYAGNAVGEESLDSLWEAVVAKVKEKGVTDDHLEQAIRVLGLFGLYSEDVLCSHLGMESGGIYAAAASEATLEA